MAKVKIYHNPRCGKSRQTLALLQERNLDIEIIEYLKDSPTAAELDALIAMLGKEPLEVMRTGEKLFKELGLSKKDERTRTEWIKIMSENPILIERPIVVNNGQAALGRPPENVLAIF
ncbi:MAG: arsenate reductase (glutaredoxin) [Deltaproteobacteria bacterium]|nr:arsenate reductase (glutaredoxin) [Deltaproteobacteria bacterium]